jgi:hypothetical protein
MFFLSGKEVDPRPFRGSAWRVNSFSFAMRGKFGEFAGIAGY